MLNKLLLPGSPTRSKIRLLARHLNFAVPTRIRSNFSKSTSEGIEQLRDLLLKEYFPSWYSGVDMEQFYASEEGQLDLDKHLTRRLEIDRYEFVPWIESVLRLGAATILEIGCGTGSATIAMGEQGANAIGLDVHREALAVAELRAQTHSIKNVSFELDPTDWTLCWSW